MTHGILNRTGRLSGMKLLVAGLLVGGSLGTFGYAAATSSPSTTVFYACLKAGTLSSVWTQSHACPTGNTVVSWDSVGPQGATGARGAVGPKGDNGTNGSPATSLSGIQFSRGYVIQEGANLRGADLHGADLTGANLTGAFLTGAFLTGATLTNANLTGVNWTNATCPNGIVHGFYNANC